jgi:acyl dehydratase
MPVGPLASIPSIWPSYLRAVVSRRPRLAPAGRAVSAELRVEGLVAPPGPLAGYRRACGFPGRGTLPLTYPHVLANPLHLALLTGPEFPVRLLGLVHLRNAIRSLRPLGDREPLGLRCALSGPRETERGQEFDIVTEASADGALAWSETSVVLARRPGGARAVTAMAHQPPAGGEDAPIRWELPAGLGRRYARLSGDWNPIHLSAPTARPFGFERAIVHGMWSLARVAAELGPRIAAPALELEAAFKLPVLLPAAVTLRAWPEGRVLAFVLRDGEGVKPHLTGTIVPA